MTEKVFEIGDVAWVGTYEREGIKTPCPVCDGELIVTLILGNGNMVILECGYCSKGFVPPRGWVIDRYEYIVDAEQFTIVGVDKRTRDGETEITYWLGNYGKNARWLSDTKEGALAKAQIHADYQVERENNTSAKHKEYKSYSWNAGYYMKQAKHAEEEAKRYHEKAKLMELKIKLPKSIQTEEVK